jgi:hypothetical protein
MRNGEIKSERMIVRRVNILSLIRGVDDKMLSVSLIVTDGGKSQLTSGGLCCELLDMQSMRWAMSSVDLIMLPSYTSIPKFRDQPGRFSYRSFACAVFGICVCFLGKASVLSENRKSERERGRKMCFGVCLASFNECGICK